MGVSSDDLRRYAPYVEGWKLKWDRIAEERRRRTERAREAAASCAKVLAEKHGARRVWLFGSALVPDRFDERSDIDLAVEGVADILRAGADCDAEAPGFEVDLVAIEDVANPRLRETILSRGELLHGPAT